MFMLLAYGGVRSVFEAVKLSALAVHGTQLTAHIVAVSNGAMPATGSVGQTGFTYRFDKYPGEGIAQQSTVVETGQTILPDRSLSQEAGASGRLKTKAYAVGDVLVFRTMNWMGHPVIHPWRPAPIGTGIFLAAAGLLVLFVSTTFLWKVVQWAQRRTLLIRTAEARIGTITHKFTTNDESPRFYVRYGFASGSSSEGIEKEEQCSSAQWRQFEVGMPVTVLVDPKDPSKYGLYKIINFR